VEGTLSRLAGYISSLQKKADDIRLGLVPGLGDSVANVVSVLVTLDDLYFVDARFRDEIERRAEADGRPVRSDVPYHILSATDFEMLCEFLRRHPDKCLIRVLRQKELDGASTALLRDYLKETYNYECVDITPVNRAWLGLWSSFGIDNGGGRPGRYVST